MDTVSEGPNAGVEGVAVDATAGQGHDTVGEGLDLAEPGLDAVAVVDADPFEGQAGFDEPVGDGLGGCESPDRAGAEAVIDGGVDLCLESLEDALERQPGDFFSGQREVVRPGDVVGGPAAGGSEGEHDHQPIPNSLHASISAFGPVALNGDGGRVAPVPRARYPPGMKWETAFLSDPGRIRQNNEDAPLVRADLGLFAVADGMGGHAAGEVASHLAIETLVASAMEAGPGLGAVELVGAFDRANRAILDQSIAEPATRGMGTTLSVLAVNGRHDGALLAHIGDSRLYRWRGGKLQQLTRDHTWVQEHIDAGVLTPEQARNHPFASVLTRVLGTTATAAPDIERLAVEKGDLFLLCSDGLTGMLEAETIAAILGADLTIDETARALVDAANAAGGADNITVVLARALE